MSARSSRTSLFALVWVFAHQLGYCWRDGSLQSARRRWALALGGLCALVVITSLGVYPRSLVALQGQERSHMFPTTAGVAALAPAGGAVEQLAALAVLVTHVAFYTGQTVRPTFGLELGKSVLLIHSGSRGLGHQVCEDALPVILGQMSRFLGATSGCPHMRLLKAMAWFHLPFSTSDETLYRALGTYLLGQFLRAKRGQSSDWSLEGLRATYRNLRQVNLGMSRRLRAAAEEDSSLNGLILLDLLAAEALSGPEHAPAILDRWRPWLALAAALIAIAYGPMLLRLATTTPLTTPGLRVW